MVTSTPAQFVPIHHLDPIHPSMYPCLGTNSLLRWNFYALAYLFLPVSVISLADRMSASLVNLYTKNTIIYLPVRSRVIRYLKSLLVFDIPFLYSIQMFSHIMVFNRINTFFFQCFQYSPNTIKESRPKIGFLMYTNLISTFRLFIQPMISKFAVSNERNSQ